MTAHRPRAAGEQAGRPLDGWSVRALVWWMIARVQHFRRRSDVVAHRPIDHDDGLPTGAISRLRPVSCVCCGKSTQEQGQPDEAPRSLEIAAGRFAGDGRTGLHPGSGAAIRRRPDSAPTHGPDGAFDRFARLRPPTLIRRAGGSDSARSRIGRSTGFHTEWWRRHLRRSGSDARGRRKPVVALAISLADPRVSAAPALPGQSRRLGLEQGQKPDHRKRTWLGKAVGPRPVRNGDAVLPVRCRRVAVLRARQSDVR